MPQAVTELNLRLTNVQVPVKKQDPNKIKDEEEEKIGKTTLLVCPKL